MTDRCFVRNGKLYCCEHFKYGYDSFAYNISAHIRKRDDMLNQEGPLDEMNNRPTNNWTKLRR